jgi:hypothetical protein
MEAREELLTEGTDDFTTGLGSSASGEANGNGAMGGQFTEK